MKIISWNSRGLRNPQAIHALRELVRREDPVIVFLSETELCSKGMDRIKMQLNYFGMIAMDSVGRSLGLALLWKKDA